jgi:hypothetical protein
MDENKKKNIIRKAVVKVRANFEKQLTVFEEKVTAKVEGKGEFSIDTIEDIWGDILKRNDEITEGVMREIGKEIREEETIKKKEKNGQRQEWY